MNEFIKSPLNYTGGKHKLLKQIVPLFPENIRTFVDLFTGGANVAVNVDAEKVVANDISEKVVDIFKAIQETPIEEVIAHVEGRVSEYGLTKENKDGYLEFRSDYNGSHLKDPLDLFVLICYSFNNQIRFNKYGEYNMPFGKNRSSFNGSIRKNLVSFSEALHNKNIVFTTKDFTELKVDKLSEDDFVYCDPPYLITCASYNEQDGWNETCERNLLSLLDSLNERNVKFALSNVLSNKGRVNQILVDWSEKYNVHHLSNTYSNCSYHAKDRSTDTTDEVLITNY